MEKTISITIAGQLFAIEEQAYQLLAAYLESIKAHFASYPEHDEITNDIESRIAEQFVESKKSGKDLIVTQAEVEKLIKVMGNVEDFAGESGGASTSDANHADLKRKLFRDPSNSVIAGVASGLSAYFTIDPVIIRIIFAASVLLGGTGILIYLVLWLAMPQATTPTEKLQMRGKHVTLESVSKIIKENIEPLKQRGTSAASAASSSLGKVLRFPLLVTTMVFTKIIPAFLRIVGVLISLYAAFLIFSLTFALSVLIFNSNSPLLEWPLREVLSRPQFYTLAIGGYLTFAIPVFLVLLAGTSLARKKRTFPTAISISLVAAWFIAAIVSGTMALRVAPQFRDHLLNDPRYQETTQEYNLKDFDKISIGGSHPMTITQGDAFKIVAIGKPRDLEAISIGVNNNLLSINNKPVLKICILCDRNQVKFEVTMPTLNELESRGSGTVSIDNLKTDQLSLILSHDSHTDITGIFKALKIHMEGAARLKLSGSADILDAKLQDDSRLEAYELGVSNATVETTDSARAYVNVAKKLITKTSNGGRIYYHGNPEIEKESDAADSSIRKEEMIRFSPVPPQEPDMSY